MLKTLSFAGIAVMTLALGASAGMAGDGPSPSPGHGPWAFSDLDTNHDGVLDKSEFAAPALRHFGDIDKDGNGAISEAEFDAVRPWLRMHGHGGPDSREGHPTGVGTLDSNGDGKVSFDEFTAPMKAHFDDMDANHDGALQAGELPGGDGPPPPDGN